jgi:hypothetical protein
VFLADNLQPAGVTMETNLSIELRNEEDTLVVCDYLAVDGPADAKKIIENAIAFVHSISIWELYIKVNDGEWIHYPNIEAQEFYLQIVKQIKGSN